MKNVFKGNIYDWTSWARIFQSVEAWEPLIHFIMEKEKLPVSKIENLEPGTNAVFRTQNHVVKIFAPKESGADCGRDYKTEIFALSSARSMGVSVPKLIACGEIEDKYIFNYMIMEYIEGVIFTEASVKFTADDKFSFAKSLREITDLFNKSCEPFNGIDVIHDQNRYKRWNNFSERFKKERLEYLNSHHFGENVFVHGDLCADNILLDKKGKIYIIDFADSVMAPLVYEHAHLAGELFKFDKSYLHGYFGEYRTEEFTDLCFDGLLIHDFGGGIIAHNIAAPEEIDSIWDLRDTLYRLIK
jgi:serine/threonine protein kinase